MKADIWAERKKAAHPTQVIKQLPTDNDCLCGYPPDTNLVAKSWRIDYLFPQSLDFLLIFVYGNQESSFFLILFSHFLFFFMDTHPS